MRQDEEVAAAAKETPSRASQPLIPGGKLVYKSSVVAMFDKKESGKKLFATRWYTIGHICARACPPRAQHPPCSCTRAFALLPGPQPAQHAGSRFGYGYA
eukprot:scaffold48450_cov39-Phaeocystis_antarctica.AAC.2